MPEPYWKERERPGKTFTLRKAAELGMLLKVRCNACRRTTYFVAADLIGIYNADLAAWRPQFPCSRCGSSDYIDVFPEAPSAGDWGNLTVRRPAGVRKIQMWKTVKLGDEP